MSTPTTALPLRLSEAWQIVANPSAYADRPHLVSYARLHLASADGRTVPQRHRAPAHLKSAPCLVLIEGSRA
ncbi:hypothetical protein BD830_1167 [Maritimibacter alkaliphilus HTCC2654]|jgi:hypothetical protein|nr:hypothetical protein BD830_1167 [Maritimibacter alkaliphilus HTCC2654]